MLNLVAQTNSRPGVIRIGVDWMYYPVARYYADRLSSSVHQYKVVVLPGDGLPFDFVYARPDSDMAQGAILRSFPAGNAVLRRGR